MPEKHTTQFQIQRQKIKMHIFLATDWENEPTESEEMKPQWFKVDKAPYQKMWKSDQEWLPIILSGKKIRAKYTYIHEAGEVVTRKIREVASLD